MTVCVECLNGKFPISSKSDIFSLGACLYYLMFKKYPYKFIRL
jgi:hypothetical protein